MAIYFDSDADRFAIAGDYCGNCGAPLYETGCDAAGCPGRECPDCGIGCDIEAMPKTGRCARKLAAESEEDREARFGAERAAFGLPPLRKGE